MHRLISLLFVLLLAACHQSPPPRKVLGGIDGDAYCKSKGAVKTYWKANPADFGGKKTWGCESADGSWGPYSIGVVCSQQYKTTAHAEQEREDDPVSWICVEGPGPANPPPSWNRANL